MKNVKLIIKYFFLAIVVVFFLFPGVFLIASSFMSGSQVFNMLNFNSEEYKTFEFIPDAFTLEQYYQALFRRPNYLLEFWNSIIITIPTVVGQVLVSILAAFAFAKFKFPFRDKLFFIYIILLILPLQVTLVPNYIIMEQFDLLNNFLSVILPGIFTAFGICLLRQSIKYVSDSTIQAARIDGASYFKILIHIILPQIKGGLLILVLLCFIDNWNVIEQPLIYFSDPSMYPLSITLLDISSAENVLFFACGVLFMVPSLLIYLYGNKDIDSPFVEVDKS